jgi:hypothetical protein
MAFQYRVKVKRIVNAVEQTAVLIVKQDNTVEITNPDSSAQLSYLMEKLRLIDLYIPWCKVGDVTEISFKREDQ